jgi:hypothetical protein
MKFRKLLWATAAIALAASHAGASLVYTCNSSVDAAEAGTCNYLNTTIAGMYNSTFGNLNADIYVQMGDTALGEGFLPDNTVSYASYVSALTSLANSDGNAVQLSAVKELGLLDNAVYSGTTVELTGALGTALGLAAMQGYTAGGVTCLLGASGCYNDVITITTPANLSLNTSNTQFLYWNQQGGTQPSNSYNFYTTVEHETDEALGTASCINTVSNNIPPTLSSFCNGGESPADLFRFSGAATRVNGKLVPGTLVPDSSLSQVAGAIFSYDGGMTNGANGAVYNTLANSNDYGDFVSSCMYVQDAEGCPGKTFNITTDGGEINILNAVGFDLKSSPSGAPEPGTMGLFGVALAGLGFWRRRRR